MKNQTFFIETNMHWNERKLTCKNIREAAILFVLSLLFSQQRIIHDFQIKTIE